MFVQSAFDFYKQLNFQVGFACYFTRFVILNYYTLDTKEPKNQGKPDASGRFALPAPPPCADCIMFLWQHDDCGGM